MSEREVSDDDVAWVAAAREEALEEAGAERLEPVAHVEELEAGRVPCRLYVPEEAPGALLYLHGGGFVLGNLTTHDAVSRRLANRTGWAVLLVDYRRAPEHAWPAADEDAAAAADWLADRGFERLVAVGDSAGAALALGETIRNPLRYDAQVLVYPFLDPGCESYDRGITGVDTDVARCEMFWRMYLQGADAAGDRALSALSGPDLVELPRTLVQLAERDVLTPTGRRLAERLTGAGVPTELVELPGVEHGFWRRTDNEQSEVALTGIGEFLAR